MAAGITTGVMLSLPAQPVWAVNCNDSINLGFIGCGGRANQLASEFEKIAGVNLAGFCDPDSSRLEIAKQKYPHAQTWNDLREMLASKNIDAVVVATCNHWHCLAAIWAMQAGKDVYVEKPLSHSQWEGAQTVAAARRFNRICQVGMQQRSDPMQTEIKTFLHEQRSLGKISGVRVNRFGLRASIGKRETPLEIEKNIAYDLWLGPANDEPIFRTELHYDWHWDWNTGSGEMGNWGVHVLDDVRNNVFQDAVTVPKKIFGGGGRLSWNDAGQTPNVHWVYFDTGSIPVVIGLSNLPAKPDGKTIPPHPGPDSGYLVYCEGGRLEGQRGRAKAFDQAGKLIREFKGDTGDGRHQQNFIDAVRGRDASLLNADVTVGHHSAGWCNLANIAVRSGGAFSVAEAREIDVQPWQGLLNEMQTHVQAHGMQLDYAAIRMSPQLELDATTGRFVGAHADLANRFLKREYRQGFAVPELAELGSSQVEKTQPIS